MKPVIALLSENRILISPIKFQPDILNSDQFFPNSLIMLPFGVLELQLNGDYLLPH